jgi:tetratricopeptide (TPR) repeat protein
MKKRLTPYVAPLLVIAVAAGLTWAAWPREGRAEGRPPLPLVQNTSRAELDAAAAIARSWLSVDAADTSAALRLAEVLLRTARVETDAAHALEAERVLKTVLKHEPGEYSALKMLGAVYLAQHRFADAAGSAQRAIAVNPDDAWNYGVLGDAYVELGDYERAFDAFDTMVARRPDAASYARVAYAYELQGRLGDALRHMRIAAEATSAHDPESLAWHYSQLGNLLLQMGRVDAAAREFARGSHAFPGHPYARSGLARVAVARGDYGRAIDLYRALMADAPTPELAASIGDILAFRGDAGGAQKMYEQAEALEREGWASEEPQPGALARMLAERSLKATEAVTLAEEAAQTRSDIYTMDALAWAYFQAGRLQDAHAASRKARRTGTADRRILCHARAIDAAVRGLASVVGGDRPQCLFEGWVAEAKTE